MAATCTHLADLEIDAEASGPGCVECALAGWSWVHLRRCIECGHIGCCDSSPHRHASVHFRETTHPLVQSYEPGEDWYWCYADKVFLELPGAGGSPSHP
jgi:uncharacterized UBP type Zn finger protein